MYRRILVPVDGSAASDMGRAQALGLARTEGARLRFLNVLDESLGLGSMDMGAVDMGDLLRSMRELGEKAVEDAASLAAASGLAADTAVLPSDGRRISDVILEEARRWEADLIVMGTHGRRGFNRLLLGSDAERVLRETPVPLLLVREQGADPAAGERRPEGEAT
jgi:nucleotide-binding universal stress UspA family protein